MTRALVVIKSEHQLVADSVRAALTARGLATAVVGHGADSDVEPPADLAALPWVGILLTHRLGEDALDAREVMERVAIPWLVLASEDRGPIWGTYYVSEAALVLPPGAGLDEVCDRLEDLAADRGPSLERERRELVLAWHRHLHQREELNDRLGTLTNREHQVLQQLHDGVGVRGIAESAEVAESTVRGQVKTILRKLDVLCQIAAVAAYARVRGEPAGG